MTAPTLSALLRLWRAVNGLGVREVGKMLGVSASTVCRIEQGKAIDQRNMLRLINALFGEKGEVR